MQIFFAISGLTMMLAHGNDFESAGASQKFAVRRLGRIVPLYWIASLVYYIKLVQTHAAPGIFALLQSLSFIPHKEAGQAFGTPVYGLGWTLQYEMFFYAMFAVRSLPACAARRTRDLLRRTRGLCAFRPVVA